MGVFACACVSSLQSLPTLPTDARLCVVAGPPPECECAAPLPSSTRSTRYAGGGGKLTSSPPALASVIPSASVANRALRSLSSSYHARVVVVS